jgi:hypothetical protein
VLRLRLLAGAWSPAAFLLALRLSADHVAWTVGLAVAGVVAVASVLLLLLSRSGTNAQPFQLTSVKDESSQVPGYLLTFVFPFMFMDVNSWREGAAWGLFALLTATLVLGTDLVLVSPVLLLAGYHLYRVDTSSGFAGILLSSRRPIRGQTIEAVRLPRGALKLTSIQE